MKRLALWFGLLVLTAFIVLLAVRYADVAPALRAQADLATATTVRSTEETTPRVPVTGEAADIGALEERLNTIYQDVNPSVVNIQVFGGPGASPQLPPGQPPGPDGSPGGPEGPPAGAGSGFIWDENGHIVTNNHVVAQASELSVLFHDGTTAPAEVVGTDPASDLAVLRIDVAPDELPPPVEVADSTALQVGQLAVAIGNPFGQAGTMTVGFISALGRSLPAVTGELGTGQFRIPDIIQTDAAINPGNSGGVLLNSEGQLVGVTTAIISPIRVSAGIGFAVPSAIVQKVIPALIEDGSFQHPFVGVQGMTLIPPVAEAMGLDRNQRGALIIEVTPESPAEEAGLQGGDEQATIRGQELPIGGDVIVEIEGEPVQEFDDLITYLARHTEVGDTISLTILRDGEQQTIDLTLAARPESGAAPLPEEGTVSRPYLGILGIDMVPPIAEAMDLPAEQKGLLIEQVDPNGPAAEAGLQGGSTPLNIDGQEILIGGDIITGIGGQPVQTVDDLRAFLEEATPGDQVTLTIIRDGAEQELEVTLSEAPVQTPE